jgi:hypothetical protein
VTAIRETKGAPWVPMSAEPALTAYTANRRLYATQSVFS